MQTKIVVCVFAALLLVNVFAHDGHDHHDHDEHDDEEEAAGPSSVTKLTPDTFDEFVKNHELTMVKFFAPWCGHCKALAPEYEKAAADLAGQGIELAEVDCTVHRDLCSRYDVQGFPTVKVFRAGVSKPVDYDQERKAEAIKKFLIKQKQPVYVVLDTKAALDQVIAEKDFVVVAFLAADDAASKDVFVGLAATMRNDFDFAIVNSAEVTQEAGVSKVPSVVVYKKADESKVEYTEEFTAAGVEKFIKMYSMPLLGTIGPENYSKYLQRGFPLVWFFVNLEKDQAVIAAATEAAKSFLGKLSFVKLDGVRWAEHGKNMGLKGKMPGVVLSEQETRKNFVFEQEITTANIVAWAQDFLDKKLTPNLKSEPIPETNDGPVKIVVGKSYEQIVMDSTKDVLLEFYAPWCGHCKALAPKYEALAEQFKSTPSIVIAKIDATENDTPMDIKGFPTLYFYPADSKSSPLQYEGERATEPLAKFVREHATTLKAAGETKNVKEDL